MDHAQVWSLFILQLPTGSVRGTQPGILNTDTHIGVRTCRLTAKQKCPKQIWIFQQFVANLTKLSLLGFRISQSFQLGCITKKKKWYPDRRNTEEGKTEDMRNRFRRSQWPPMVLITFVYNIMYILHYVSLLPWLTESNYRLESVRHKGKFLFKQATITHHTFNTKHVWNESVTPVALPSGRNTKILGLVTQGEFEVKSYTVLSSWQGQSYSVVSLLVIQIFVMIFSGSCHTSAYFFCFFAWVSENMPIIAQFLSKHTTAAKYSRAIGCEHPHCWCVSQQCFGQFSAKLKPCCFRGLLRAVVSFFFFWRSAWHSGTAVLFRPIPRPMIERPRHFWGQNLHLQATQKYTRGR